STAGRVHRAYPIATLPATNSSTITADDAERITGVIDPVPCIGRRDRGVRTSSSLTGRSKPYTLRASIGRTKGRTRDAASYPGPGRLPAAGAARSSDPGEWAGHDGYDLRHGDRRIEGGAARRHRH